MPEILNEDGTPAVLSPEDQAAVLQQAAAQEPPELTDPNKPLTYESDGGPPPTIQEQAAIRKAANLVDPLLDLAPAEMMEYSRQTAEGPPDKQFNILNAFLARQEEVSQDPEAVKRVGTAWQLYKDSTSLSDLPGLGEMATVAKDALVGGVDYIATLFGNLPTRLTSEAGSPANLEATRNLAEVAAASQLPQQGRTIALQVIPFQE